MNRFQNFLIQNNLSFRIVEFENSTHTAQQAADELNCNVSQIVKSLLFRSTKSDQLILVLVSGSNRVNLKLLNNSLEKKKMQKNDAFIMLNPDFVEFSSGYVVGSVPPFGHIEKIETFIDKDLLRFDTVYPAAGTINSVFEISPPVLLKITKAKEIQVV